MPGLYMQCACGEPIGKNRWRSGKRTCVPCGIAKGVIANREMHEKTGATYSKWQSGLLKWLLDNNSSDGENVDDNPGESREHH